MTDHEERPHRGTTRRLELHVAALPFPTYQGTQAAIRSMLEARVRHGHAATLLTYGARGYAFEPTFPLHRTEAARAATLRSGPSLQKLAHDAHILLELRRLAHRLQPRVIVAHHVEAATLSLVLNAAPTLFFAHTDLGAELPGYGARSHARLLGWAGRTLDRGLLARAAAVATISPALCDKVAVARADTTAPVYVPTPWPVPSPIGASERAQSRRELGLAADGCVALYAGNLDAYQDARSMLEALARLRRERIEIILLLATESDPRAFLQAALTLGVPFRTCSLGDESVRRRVHAAADLAIIPRGVAFGLPIKLLDALARGVPCAVAPHATAGIDLQDTVVRADKPGSKALAAAIATLASDAGLRQQLAGRGRAYVAREHSDDHFNVALDRAIANAAAEP